MKSAALLLLAVAPIASTAPDEGPLEAPHSTIELKRHSPDVEAIQAIYDRLMREREKREAMDKARNDARERLVKRLSDTETIAQTIEDASNTAAPTPAWTLPASDPQNLPSPTHRPAPPPQTQSNTLPPPNFTPPPPPPPPGRSWGDALGIWAALIGAILLIGAIERWAAQLRRAPKLLLKLINPNNRNKSSIYVCGGLALALCDFLLLDDLKYGHPLWKAHHEGWISLAAGAVTLVGLYKWMTLPPDRKI